MNSEIEFKQNLNRIKENALISVHSWSGVGYPGYRGIIVTHNKEIYTYEYYHIVPQELKENNINHIKKIKDLNSYEYKSIIKFIEKEILNKEFSYSRLFDAGFNVLVNYNGINKIIENDIGVGNTIGLYDKAEKLLKGFLK